MAVSAGMHGWMIFEAPSGFVRCLVSSQWGCHRHGMQLAQSAQLSGCVWYHGAYMLQCKMVVVHLRWLRCNRHCYANQWVVVAQLFQLHVCCMIFIGWVQFAGSGACLTLF